MSEFLASIPPIVVCLIVCCAKIVEITIQSLKTCMMVKGERLKAAGLGFIECVIWGLVISTIIGTLGDNLFLLLFYCIGYASGLFIGSFIESKIALGTSNLELIANDESTELITEYLKYIEYLAKWNGELPGVMTGDSANIMIPVGGNDSIITPDTGDNGNS